MKFFYTADIHWSMTPDSDSPWSRGRYQAIKDTLTRIITKARDAEVNRLFISEDLFRRQSLARDLKGINYLFTTTPGVRIIIIADNHSRIRTNSALLSSAWAPNMAFVMNEGMTSVYFEDINTEIHEFSCHTMDIKENWTEDIKVPEGGRIHILTVHGGDATHLPFDRKSLAEARLSYAALGHIHKPGIIAGGRMAYPGPPEPLDKTETGPYGVLLGEVSSTTLKLESLNFVLLSKSQYIPLAISIMSPTISIEPDLRTFQEIEKRGWQNLYRFRVCGMRDPDLTFDFENLKTKYRVVEALDEAEPQYDFGAPLVECPGDMIGFYI